MSEKKTIRIVKKGENIRPAAKPKVYPTGEAARQMIETVTNWVIEFQQKRRHKAVNALRILSKNSQNDSGSVGANSNDN